jgi:hypothetical protein
MLAVPVFINRSPNMPAVPALLVNMATLPKLVAVPTPNEMVTKLPEAILPSPPSIITVPPLVLPSPEARVKLPLLLIADDPETIDASPPAIPNKLPVITLNTPPMLVPEPTEIAMLMLELDADKKLLISKVPLLPTLAVPVFNNESPNTPPVPALFVNIATLPELVAVPTPDEVVMEPPEAVLPLGPTIVTAPLLVLPSPKARVKILLLLVDDDSETIDPSTLAAPDMLPAITLKAPPMLVPESAEIAMLPSKPDADKPLPNK